MKTSICLLFLGILFATCDLSTSSDLCYQTCTKLVAVYHTAYFYFWGHAISFRYVARYETVPDRCQIPCPVDCTLSEWDKTGEWTECSATCEKGERSQLQTREIITEAAHGGKCWELQRIHTETCDMGHCPESVCKNETVEKRNGHGKHFQNCYKFIHCQETGTEGSFIANEMPCSEGTAWDETAFTCTQDALRNCPDYEHLCNDGDYYASKKDCARYYMCAHNKLHPKTCFEPTPYWNQVTRSCSKDKKACREENICTGNEGKLVKDPESKNHYYSCSIAGVPHKMPCPGKLEFNGLLCDHPKNG